MSNLDKTKEYLRYLNNITYLGDTQILKNAVMILLEDYKERKEKELQINEKIPQRIVSKEKNIEKIYFYTPVCVPECNEEVIVYSKKLDKYIIGIYFNSIFSLKGAFYDDKGEIIENVTKWMYFNKE